MKILLPAFLCVAITFCNFCAHAEEPVMPPIIPKPMSLKAGNGNGFVLTPGQTKVTIIPESRNPAVEAVADQLAQRLGITKTNDSGNIILSVSDIGSKNPEAYKLSITDKEIRITGQTVRGLGWGMQTLFQLCPPDIYKKPAAATLPPLDIFDYPDYNYRGMHFDVSRHFFTIKEVKTFIDVMAMHKLNVLHFHLTDDQGWRIEIKKYPKLIELGSTRAESPRPGARAKGDGKPYGPFFYTQPEIKEIVQYAMDRQIEVIPEIEMPGHAQAALTAYPQFGCTGGPYTVRTRWGISDEVFCAGNDETIQFLKDVLEEVMPLFPSKNIHVGGDECSKPRWNACPKCQARIKNQKLKNSKDLQRWFMTQISDFVRDQGKNIVIWYEAAEGEIPPGATIISWRGIDDGVLGASKGHEVILSPKKHSYFDYAQGRGPQEPESIGNYVPLEQVYDFNISAGFTPEQAKFIRGPQATLWSEYFYTTESLFYHALPRMAAIAEAGWTPYTTRNFNDFQYRLMTNFMRYDAIGVNFRFAPPVIIPEHQVFESKTALDLGHFPPHYTLFYKIDNGPFVKYEKSVEITASCKVTFYAILTKSNRKSLESTITFSKAEKIEPADITPQGEEGLKTILIPGTFKSCVDLEKAPLQKEVISKDFNIAVKEAPQNNYGMIWNGVYVAPEDGAYTFTLNSDDGAILKLNQQIVINHDGPHHINDRAQKTVILKKGYYHFNLNWFDSGAGKGLKITVKINNGKVVPLKDNMFKRISRD